MVSDIGQKNCPASMTVRHESGTISANRHPRVLARNLQRPLVVDLRPHSEIPAVVVGRVRALLVAVDRGGVADPVFGGVAGAGGAVGAAAEEEGDDTGLGVGAQVRSPGSAP